MDIIAQGLANLGFDWKMALASLVNFLIVFWLLKHFLFDKLEGVLGTRRKTIEKGLDDARKAEAELEGARTKKEEILKEARSEANDVVSGAHEQGEQVRSDLKEQAEKETAEMKKRAEASIEHARQDMEREVQEKTAGMIVSSVEKILREEVDEKRGNELIKKVTSS